MSFLGTLHFILEEGLRCTVTLGMACNTHWCSHVVASQKLPSETGRRQCVWRQPMRSLWSWPLYNRGHYGLFIVVKDFSSAAHTYEVFAQQNFVICGILQNGNPGFSRKERYTIKGTLKASSKLVSNEILAAVIRCRKMP